MKLFTIRVYYHNDELFNCNLHSRKITINPALIWQIKEVLNYPEFICIYIGTDDYIIRKSDFGKFGIEIEELK